MKDRIALATLWGVLWGIGVALLFVGLDRGSSGMIAGAAVTISSTSVCLASLWFPSPRPPEGR